MGAQLAPTEDCTCNQLIYQVISVESAGIEPDDDEPSRPEDTGSLS
jgi:hypothetical protein